MPVQNSSVIREPKSKVSQLEDEPHEHVHSVHDDEAVNSVGHLLVAAIARFSGVEDVHVEEDGKEDEGRGIDEYVEDDASLKETFKCCGLELNKGLRLRIGPLWGNRR